MPGAARMARQLGQVHQLCRQITAQRCISGIAGGGEGGEAIGGAAFEIENARRRSVSALAKAIRGIVSAAAAPGRIWRRSETSLPPHHFRAGQQQGERLFAAFSPGQRIAGRLA